MTTHPDYDASLPAWLRARDVLAGEDAIKSAAEKYLPRLQDQTDAEYHAYRSRAAFFNATARTADGYLGLLFRRPPFIKTPAFGTPRPTPSASCSASATTHAKALPRSGSRITNHASLSLSLSLHHFLNDADLLGTPLAAYARNVAREVIAVGRAGTLIDWESQSENRVYASLYTAENILNWRVERLNGRNLLTLLVLRETIPVPTPLPDTTTSTNATATDFQTKFTDQIRVLRLHSPLTIHHSPPSKPRTKNQEPSTLACHVELYRQIPSIKGPSGSDLPSRSFNPHPSSLNPWTLVHSLTPLRLGKPLPLIPFVFHGSTHSLPDVDRLPLADIIAVNLDHYRLHADYRHGMHYTALPTAWVSGFDKSSVLRIGSSTAWIAPATGATAGFLEYTGQGLTTFERAMDRDERLMAVLGARLLENQKRIGEAAEAIELKQNGENSILGALAQNLSLSLTQVLRWAHWWTSSSASTATGATSATTATGLPLSPEELSPDQILVELNTDYSTRGLTAAEIVAVVQAWQAGALSRDSMLDIFRRGEVLPEGRSNQEEISLIQNTQPALP